MVETAAAAGVPLSGENALQRYDHFAFDRIAESAFGHQARAGCLESLTFLRMGEQSLRKHAVQSTRLRHVAFLIKEYPLLIKM